MKLTMAEVIAQASEAIRHGPLDSRRAADQQIPALADPSREYHYLCGPMSWIPGFNIPRFLQVAEKLRKVGSMNIISPAEQAKNVEHRERYLASDGCDPDLVTDGKQGQDELRDDLRIVIDPNCIGVICLEGWAKSRGGRAEAYIAEALGLPLYGYLDDGDGFTLVQFDREDFLCGEELKRIRESIQKWSVDPHHRTLSSIDTKEN